MAVSRTAASVALHRALEHELAAAGWDGGERTTFVWKGVTN